MTVSTRAHSVGHDCGSAGHLVDLLAMEGRHFMGSPRGGPAAGGLLHPLGRLPAERPQSLDLHDGHPHLPPSTPPEPLPSLLPDAWEPTSEA